jgi:hypothetical protein
MLQLLILHILSNLAILVTQFEKVIISLKQKVKVMKKEKFVKTFQTDLSGRQSVRTTFKLSQKAYDDIVWLANHHNITLKDVFDILCSKLESSQEDDTLIKMVAKSIRIDNFNASIDAIRKTHVITKNSLAILDELSKEYQVPRDALVEKAIMTFKALIDANLQKAIENHKKALDIVSKFWSNSEDVEHQLKKLLGDDDPIVTRFGYIVVLAMNLHSAIEHELKDGTPIDPNDFSQG